jgi:hypothetical protein
VRPLLRSFYMFLRQIYRDSMLLPSSRPLLMAALFRFGMPAPSAPCAVISGRKDPGGLLPAV